MGKTWGTLPDSSKDIWKSYECDSIVGATPPPGLSPKSVYQKEKEWGDGVVTKAPVLMNVTSQHFEKLLESCLKLKEKYHIVLGESWGDSSPDIISKWKNDHCDTYFEFLRAIVKNRILSPHPLPPSILTN